MAGGIAILGQIAVDAAFLLTPLLNLKAMKTHAKEYLGLAQIKPLQDAKNTVIVLVVLFVLAVGTSWLLWLAGIDDSWKVEKAVQGMAASAPALLAYLLVVRAVSEEVFFRGFLAKKIGILPSAAVFALSHAAYGSIAEISGALVLGVWLGFIYIRNKSLVSNILGHMLYNFVAIMLIL